MRQPALTMFLTHALLLLLRSRTRTTVGVEEGASHLFKAVRFKASIEKWTNGVVSVREPTYEHVYSPEAETRQTGRQTDKQIKTEEMTKK